MEEDGACCESWEGWDTWEGLWGLCKSPHPWDAATQQGSHQRDLVL